MSYVNMVAGLPCEICKLPISVCNKKCPHEKELLKQHCREVKTRGREHTPSLRDTPLDGEFKIQDSRLKIQDLKDEIIKGYAEDFFGVVAETESKMFYVKHCFMQGLAVDIGDWEELLLRLEICALRMQKIIKVVKRGHTPSDTEQ